MSKIDKLINYLESMGISLGVLVDWFDKNSKRITTEIRLSKTHLKNTAIELEKYREDQAIFDLAMEIRKQNLIKKTIRVNNAEMKIIRYEVMCIDLT